MDKLSMQNERVVNCLCVSKSLNGLETTFLLYTVSDHNVYACYERGIAILKGVEAGG